MFFFHTLATVIPTSYQMKTVCFAEFENSDACPPSSPCFFPNAEQLIGEESDQSLCVRKEALELMLMSIVPMIRCYIIVNVQMCSKASYFSKVGLGYIGNSAISL